MTRLLVALDDGRAQQWDDASLREYVGDTPATAVRRIRHRDGTETVVTDYRVQWPHNPERWTRVRVTETFDA